MNEILEYEIFSNRSGMFGEICRIVMIDGEPAHIEHFEVGYYFSEKVISIIC